MMRRRGVLVVAGAVVVAVAILAFTSLDHVGSGAGSARLALSELRSAHLRLAVAETRFDRRKCPQQASALGCEIRYGNALRLQLLAYAAAVKGVSLPSATAHEIALRVEKAAVVSAGLISQINQAKSISEYSYLGTALNPTLSSNYYELEDNATYLAYVLEGHGG